MKLGLLNVAGYVNLLKRLQGSGYASDDDSVRVAELTGVATVAYYVGLALENTVRNVFVSHAEEALDEHDRVYSMPSDTNQTTDARRARLVAFTRALPKMLRARIQNSMTLWAGVPTAVTAPQPATATEHACSQGGGLLISQHVPGATASSMRVVDAILTRGAPARMLCKRGASRLAETGFDVERSQIYSAPPAGTPPTAGAPIVAPFEVFPGSVITLDEYHEMQAMQFWAPRIGSTGTGTLPFSLMHGTTAGGEHVYFEGIIPPSGTLVLDATGFAWENRVVQAWLAVTSGGAFTDTTVGGISHGYLSPSKLGVSFAPYAHAFRGFSNLSLTIDAIGRLILTNASIGATYHFKMHVRKTQIFRSDTFESREPWIDGTVHDSYATFAMHKAAYIRSGTDPTYANLESPGTAVRRILYTGSLRKTSNINTPTVVKLDSSIDWRNRCLLVTHLVGTSATSTLFASANPMPARVTDEGGAGVTRLFLTGNGSVSNFAAQNAFQFPAGDVWLYVDTVTGHLMAEMKSISVNEYAHAFFMVTATSKRGAQLTAPEPINQGFPSVYPVDLNRAQNMGCYAQGQSASATTLVTAPPLGTIVDGGMPARPVAWMVRERIGRANDPLVEVRQKIYGQRKRLISLQVNAGQTIDIEVFNDADTSDGQADQVDYRDRLVFIEGTVNTLDISLGAPVQQSDAVAAKFAAVLYTGPYGDQTISLPGSLCTLTFEFKRVGTGVFHSRMRITAAAGNNPYVNMCIEMTGHLGLTDRRLNGRNA